jgi:hypothetical protein
VFSVLVFSTGAYVNFFPRIMMHLLRVLECNEGRWQTIAFDKLHGRWAAEAEDDATDMRRQRHAFGCKVDSDTIAFLVQFEQDM